MKTERFWFYFGLFILAVAWGPFLIGFLVIITGGAILFPLVALIYFGAWVGVQELLWNRPIAAILGILSMGCLAFSVSRESEGEPYWRLVRNRVNGDMELRLIEPGLPKSEGEADIYWLLRIKANGGRELHLVKPGEESRMDREHTR